MIRFLVAFYLSAFLFFQDASVLAQDESKPVPIRGWVTSTSPPREPSDDSTTPATVTALPLDQEAGTGSTSPLDVESFTPSEDTPFLNALGASGATSDQMAWLSTQFLGDRRERLNVGIDFYLPSDFDEGLVIRSEKIALKIGGYVKADLIHDFDPIGSTDSFITRTIELGAADRQNTRFHARQTRLNFDTRWPTDWGTARAFVEGDFFSEGDQFRLRHAYGEIGRVIIGQTWTTFTDVASAPTTLDFEGSTSAITIRRAQFRWTQPLPVDHLSLALAVEDPLVDVEFAPNRRFDPRTESPDFVSHLRYAPDWGSFQVAGLIRRLGGQLPGQPVSSETAWGFHFTGALLPTEKDKLYYQILFGEGIGSLRGLPDAAPVSPERVDLLGTFAWMIGYTHAWTDQLSSNLVYSVSRLNNLPFQPPTDLHRTQYFAVNAIWNPVERVFFGIEYLYGTRENIDGQRGDANRLQISAGFILP